MGSLELLNIDSLFSTVSLSWGVLWAHVQLLTRSKPWQGLCKKISVVDSITFWARQRDKADGKFVVVTRAAADRQIGSFLCKVDDTISSRLFEFVMFCGENYTATTSLASLSRLDQVKALTCTSHLNLPRHQSQTRTIVMNEVPKWRVTPSTIHWADDQQTCLSFLFSRATTRKRFDNLMNSHAQTRCLIIVMKKKKCKSTPILLAISQSNGFIFPSFFVCVKFDFFSSASSTIWVGTDLDLGWSTDVPPLSRSRSLSLFLKPLGRGQLANSQTDKLAAIVDVVVLLQKAQI